MKVSDEERQNLSMEVSAHVTQRAWRAWQEMHDELMSLRKVAKEAVSAVSIAYTQGEPRAKWEPLLAALREAGL